MEDYIATAKAALATAQAITRDVAAIMRQEITLGEQSGFHGTYRVISRTGQGIPKRQYWVQRRSSWMFEGEYSWKDVWGPYYQRPAVFRKLAECAGTEQD